MKHIQYLLAVIKHKWFVGVAGYYTKTPIIQLIVHDMSKFTKAEWSPYAEQFYGKYKGQPTSSEFRAAVKLHKSRNKHHEDYWGKQIMPEKYIREMLADWLGACRAYQGVWPRSMDEWPWILANIHKVQETMHPDSFKVLRGVLFEYFKTYGSIGSEYRS